MRPILQRLAVAARRRLGLVEDPSQLYERMETDTGSWLELESPAHGAVEHPRRDVHRVAALVALNMTAKHPETRTPLLPGDKEFLPKQGMPGIGEPAALANMGIVSARCTTTTARTWDLGR